MNNQFVLGVLLGVAGSLVPDLATWAEIAHEKPEYRTYAIMAYLLFIAMLVLLFLETYK